MTKRQETKIKRLRAQNAALKKAVVARGIILQSIVEMMESVDGFAPVVEWFPIDAEAGDEEETVRVVMVQTSGADLVSRSLITGAVRLALAADRGASVVSVGGRRIL